MNRISATGELLLYGEIGSWADELDAQAVIASLEEATGDEITVRIHSGGGSIMEGLAIYNRLKQSGKRIIVYIDGLAASMASVIAMAGDEIHMPENAWMMIHQPWLSTAGTAQDLRKNADTLDGFEASLLKIYQAKTKLPADELAAMLAAETWLSAETALELGFIDSITTELKAVASIDLSNFHNVPGRLPTELHMTDDVKDTGKLTTAEAKAAARFAKAETERVTAINKFVEFKAIDAETAKMLIEDGVSLERAREYAFKLGEAKNNQYSPSGIRPTSSRDDPNRMQCYAEVIAGRASGRELSPPAEQFRHKTLHQMARDLLEEKGINTSRKSPSDIVAHAMHSTSDFPELLVNGASRMLRSAYEALPSAIMPIASRTTARDFRPITHVQLSEAPTLLPIPEGGEYSHGTMGESAEAYRLGTFGRMFSLSRQAIINDDLGAFQKMTGHLGRAVAEFEAGFLLEQIISAAKMRDNRPLFHADHKNLGVAGPLSEATLSEARLKMRSQKGLDGKTPVDARPRFLLVPASLETTAEKLLTVIQAHSSENVNPFSNLQLLVEPRLDAVSATAWYMFADPMVMPSLEYAYLETAQGPVIDVDRSFETDAVKFRVRLDIGAGLIDYRGAFKNEGA